MDLLDSGSFSQSICPLLFGGRNPFSHTKGGTNIFTYIHTRGRDKLFYKGVSGNNNIDGEKEEDVSEANILVSETSKLSAGARILRGPEILV